MKFAVHATAPGSGARAATLETSRGAIATPVFMPVGTRGTVRTQTPSQLAALAAPILLANTYHLSLRPGAEALAQLGGLHRWMGWPGAILTDSGGFQIFSLPGTEIDDAGARLCEPGGRTQLLTPERSIATQRAIGADIMMVLDHCVASTCARAEAEAAMQRTHRWAARSLAARVGSDAALFAIVQGARFPELRRASAGVLTEMTGFDGYAIGGLAVGETRAEREDITALVAEHLPADRPRYLMGVGMPIDLLEGVHRGVDMFDCILPTALAQHGVAFTSRGRIDLARGVHRLAEQPLDPACACEACARPRSYLHHLVKCMEPVGWQLLAFHNLAFYLRLMAEIRAHIHAGTFAAFYAAQRPVLERADPDNPPSRRPRVKPRKPRSRGAFALHAASDGVVRVARVASGERMHPVDAPDAEAARIYVEQSTALGRALAAPGGASGDPVVVWDVGLGAGHNAMALVHAAERSPDHAPIALVSFERDLDVFRLALDHVEHFPHLRHRAPHVLAHRGSVRTDRLAWTLCEGDFLATFEAQPQPDVIFYDPLSADVDAELWSLAAFTRLYAWLARPVELFTYTRSTAIRSAMLAAGFHVARGAASGAKTETTIALARIADPGAYPLLGRDWLDQRARSSARFPAGVPAEQHAALERAIHAHAQFAT